MLQQVNNYIIKNKIFHQGNTVIAAVSGGPDSIAMLHILKTLAPQLGIKIAAAHLNHQLRNEAYEEEAFVKNMCREWQIPFYVRGIDVRKSASDLGKSIEEAARDCRYKYFEELRQELGADLIATAHHRDDNAETILLHLIRGSGIRGLRGILPINGHLVRPLLGVNREAIEKYLEVNSLSYRIDSSNFDTRFMRNRVRHELIPYLQKEFNPRIIENLDTMGLIVREEYEAMEIETNKLIESVLLYHSNKRIIIDNSVFSRLYSAFQRRIILCVLADLEGDYGWSAMDVKLIMDLNEKEGSAKRIKLRKGIWVYKVYDQLIIGENIEQDIQFCYPVKIPGSINITETGAKYQFIKLSRDEFTNRKPNQDDIYLDYENLSNDIVLRSRAAGDRIRLPGMKGRKKVKDYFIDKKVPVLERDKTPLLASQDLVYAIIGYDVSVSARVTEKTRSVLVIRREFDEN